MQSCVSQDGARYESIFEETMEGVANDFEKKLEQVDSKLSFRQEAPEVERSPTKL